jgi:centrosomal protein CEP76
LNQTTCHKRYSSTLSNRRGNVDDHCHLLCGMLLGFGLKAYVVVGHSVTGEHSWVMTTSKDSIIFWECTKGQKFDYFSPKTFKFYKSVHIVYNHIEYYANIQLDDSISGTKFDFQNKNLWKSLSSDLISDLPSYNRYFYFLTQTTGLITPIFGHLQNRVLVGK